MEEYTIRCDGCEYVTLEWNDKFLKCFDNDMMYAEDIILAVEKRSGMNFKDISIKGNKEDFIGLRFFNGGWKRNFWDDFPSRNELDGYKKMKYGR